jgi:hypothetical protein
MAGRSRSDKKQGAAAEEIEEMVEYTNGFPASMATRLVLTGAELRATLRGKSATYRANLAAELVRGTVVLFDPTPAQAARIVSCNPGGLSVAMGNKGKRGPRDSTVDRAIRRLGPDALMRGLDRATAPQRLAAE